MWFQCLYGMLSALQLLSWRLKLFWSDGLGSNKTIVQPDVFVVCDHRKLTRSRVEGAPDFVAEILSPSTRCKDMTLKRMWCNHDMILDNRYGMGG